MTNTKNNKKWGGHLIGVWSGDLMKGEWHGEVCWSENGKWSGKGNWEGEDLKGEWKVGKGSWVSKGNGIRKWEGSGTAKVGTRDVFKRTEVVILIAVITIILNTISFVLKGFVGGLEGNTNIINIVISGLLGLLTVAKVKEVGQSTKEGKWQLSGTWREEGEYRILYMKEGTWKLGQYEGELLGTEYSFSWDDIPKNDRRFIEFLTWKFGIDWVKTAKIEQIDGDRTIKLTDEKNYLSLELNNKKTKVNLKIDDGRSAEFIAKSENGKLNIYEEEHIGSISGLIRIGRINDKCKK